MKMNVTSLYGLWSRGLRGACVSIVALVAVIPSALARQDAPAGVDTAGDFVRLEAAHVPGERVLEARIERVIPIEKAAAAGAFGGTERGGPSGLLHSNISTYINQNFLNGGASGTGSAAITKLISGQLFLTAPGTVNQAKFVVVNTLGTPVTARPLIRFHQTNGGGGGPGTFIVGFTFNPITFPANQLTLVIADIGAAALPASVWAGITFDAGGNGPALATLAQLNALGMGLFSPVDVGDINGQMFRTTSAGSFASNNPAGSQSANQGTCGWELRTTDGGCCLGTGPCVVTDEIDCLNRGGNYRGDGSDCTACSAPASFFNAPPPPGFYYGLDQISLCDISSNLLQKRSSQQVAISPPSNLNIAVIDEFTLTQKRVIARVDSLVGVSGAGSTLPPPDGFLLSIWASPSAAATDATLQGNTLYDQGYTVPLFRGGGEYDLVSFAGGGGNPLGLKGVAVKVDPTIALRPDEVGPRLPDERGISPTQDNGLVLAPGTYYVSIIHRANAAWGNGQIADSNHQDPRFPADNAFQVNPGGGVFAGGSRNINVPAAYRVLMRNCKGDFNGDGSVNTIDLVAFLGAFGTSGTAYTPFDLNRDLAVNTADLVEFLGLFGLACR
jgi:hypothetical protein